jgi:hypothetical protein
MASEAADALAKTYARNEIAFAWFHHKWFTADRIAGRLHTPRFGAQLVRIFLERARERDQISKACCEQHHGQRQREWRKMR